MANGIIEIDEGKVKGCLLNNYDGDNVYAFLGVPYAEPPIGNLRFRAPYPVKPWSGVKDATKDGNICIQRQNNKISGSEDCLHLNIYTRDINNTSKLKPVMVWIHTGGFIRGSNESTVYPPDFLLTKDIVLMSINYRLGVFGFLSLNDSNLEVFGNTAFKDQRLALQWIQRNIHHFNGDRDNVTLIGQSSGSRSAHYHILSPGSKGLFHKVILQSGVALNEWKPSHKGLQVDELLDILGKKANSDKEALEILRALPAEELYLAQEKYLQTIGMFQLPFYASIEQPNPTEFLTESPMKLISTGKFNKVPMILGITSAESGFFKFYAHILQGQKIKTDLPNPDYFIPKSIFDYNTRRSIVKTIKEIYFGKKNSEDKYLLAGDSIFNYGTILAANLHAKMTDDSVYLYIMDIMDDLNTVKKMLKCEDIPGMFHMEDINYLFNSTNEVKLSDTAERHVRTLVEMWTQFAEYSKPTFKNSILNVVWEPVSKECTNYLYIGKTLKMEKNPFPDRIEVWNNILKIAESSYTERTV